MQKAPGALLLAALLLALSITPVGAQDAARDSDEEDAEASRRFPGDPDSLVPGTDRHDLLIDRPRTWALEERDDTGPREPVLSADPQDPGGAVVTAQVYTDLAAMEAALLRREGSDAAPRLQPVFNVGTILSSIRFDPPLALEGGGTLDTLDAPRLDWSLPAWENETARDPETHDEHHRTQISVQATIPRPDDNGTSPPPGGRDPEDQTGTDTGLQLTWNVLVTNRSLPYPLALLSPAALRFSWTLEGPHNETFAEDQRLRWVFLYDYDTIRTVVRPEPTGMMDGAYLVSGDHRAALRLATVHSPLDPPREEGGPIRSRLVDLEVRPSAGGEGPDAEGRPLPSPLVLEAHTRPVGHPTRGYTYSGEIRFYEAAPAPDDGNGNGDGENGDDGDGEDPVGPTGGWPLHPRLWQVLLVLVLALLLLVPKWRRSAASTTP